MLTAASDTAVTPIQNGCPGGRAVSLPDRRRAPATAIRTAANNAIPAIGVNSRVTTAESRRGSL